jgi:hypothetical protein
MDILLAALGALWKVVAVGLFLGAGLPALFSLGVRSLDVDRVLVTNGSEITSRASRRGRAGAIACFALCAVGVLFGIIVIVFGKQLFS